MKVSFSLKRYAKKHGENSYVIVHKDVQGDFSMRLVKYEDVDEFRKKYELITGPGKKAPYPRYAVSKEVVEALKHLFKD